MPPTGTAEIIQKIRDQVGRVMVGKQDAVDHLLIALISGGHVLLEDIPGIGKTTLASAMARSLGLSFRRIQFTPDIMPSDITGFNMYNQKTGQFDYHPGSVMSQIVLADEINRTSPRTQSSLLEAMQERQVTVDGTTYPVPRPFMVLATQNPIEQIGTYPLPEAQLDRFMLKLSLGYPSLEEEMDMYERFAGPSPLDTLQPAAHLSELNDLQDAGRQIYCATAIRRYIALLARATRQHPDLTLGVSPRGALMLLQAAKGQALLQGRDYIVPDDILTMMPFVFAHRMLLKEKGRRSGQTALQILDEIRGSITIPES